MIIPEIEKQSFSEIKRFQGQKLSQLLQYLKLKSPFYSNHFKKHGIDIDKIDNVEDLTFIPPTRKEDLQAGASQFICVSHNKIVDYLTTSGTSGDPVPYVMTEKDLRRLSYNEYLGFMCADCSKNEIFQLMTTIDRRFMAGLAYFMGSRRLKSAMIRVGNGIPELQWDTIKRFSPTALVAVPSFLLNIIEYAEKNGIDHHSSSVNKAICIGDSLRNTDFSFNSLEGKFTNSGLKLSSIQHMLQLKWLLHSPNAVMVSEGIIIPN